MYSHRIVSVLCIGLMAGACADTPTGIDRGQDAGITRVEGVAASQHQTSDLLSSIPVAGELTGGTFTGVLSITELAFADGQLVASGTLTGTAEQISGGGTVVTDIAQEFTGQAIDLTSEGGGCQILLLEIPGGLELDLLGLVVDLAPVELEIRAERGPGNLLGNLLCAVTGLLDGLGALSGLLNLLDRINDLL